MAFSVKIVGVPKRKSEPIFEMEPAWGDSEKLMKDRRFTVSNDTRSYLDYDARLTAEATRELHEQFKPTATTGVYQFEDWQKIIQPQLRDLESVLYERSSEFSHFHVNVFEWESGL